MSVAALSIAPSSERYRSLPSITKTVKRYTAIYSYGQEADAVYFVITGRVLLYVWSVDSQSIPRERCIGIRGPGEAFGARHGFTTHDEEARVETEFATLRVYRSDMIPRDLLAAEVQRQNADLKEHLSVACAGSLQVKLARLLCILHGRRAFGAGNCMALTQTCLAKLASATRETTGRAVSEMKEARLISVEPSKSIRILDMQGLRRWAGYETA